MYSIILQTGINVYVKMERYVQVYKTKFGEKQLNFL